MTSSSSKLLIHLLHVSMSDFLSPTWPVSLYTITTAGPAHLSDLRVGIKECTEIGTGMTGAMDLEVGRVMAIGASVRAGMV